MTDEKCCCGEMKPGKACPGGDAGKPLPYWCNTCDRAVAEKRCPLCGLKARKIRNH